MKENGIYQCPYLLIDLRPGSDFSREHIITALCHPIGRLARAVGWENPEMLTYKNHSDWIIVLYDENEDLAPDAAATLIHRGYQNIFVLSGGLHLVRDKIGPPVVTTDQSRNLQPKIVEFISERLAHVIVPPLSMVDAPNWWIANGNNSGSDRSVKTPGSSSKSSSSLSRNKSRDRISNVPWK